MPPAAAWWAVWRGELFAAPWHSPAEWPRGFQWNWSLWYSQVKHLACRKRAGYCNTGFAPFWSCADNFYWTWRFFAGIWKECARGHVTWRSQSLQSRMVGGTIANTSFDAWVEDEPPCMLVCSWMHGWSFLYIWWGGCSTNFEFCHTNLVLRHINFFRFSGFLALKGWCLNFAMQNCHICRHFVILVLIFMPSHTRTSSQWVILPHQLFPKSSTYGWMALYVCTLYNYRCSRNFFPSCISHAAFNF